MILSAFIAEEQVEVVLPELPPAAQFAGGDIPGTWTVRWVNAEGLQEYQMGVRKKCTLSLNKGTFTPIIAELDTKTSRIGPFPVAGALYPAQAEGSLYSLSISLGYTGGIAAISALRAMESATGGIETARSILSVFNWKRLVFEIEKLSTPYYFDFDRLVSAMLTGQVRIYDVRPRTLRAVRITLPEGLVVVGSKLIEPWPGAQGFYWPETNTISLELPIGMCRFYNEDGVLTVQSGGATPRCVFFSPYCLQE